MRKEWNGRGGKRLLPVMTPLAVGRTGCVKGFFPVVAGAAVFPLIQIFHGHLRRSVLSLEERLVTIVAFQAVFGVARAGQDHLTLAGFPRECLALGYRPQRAGHEKKQNQDRNH